MKIKEILSEAPTMVFPLQQKIELLKKVAGEDSIFSDQEEDLPGFDEGEEQNSNIKKAANKDAGLRLRTALSADDTPFAE